MSAARALLIASALAALAPGAPAYPLYGSEDRRIGRVEAGRLAQEGELPGRQQVAGALLPLEAVDLRLLEHPDLTLPAPDPGFTREVVRLLGEEAGRYGIAVLDLSDPSAPRYAEHRGTVASNPGSVGKVLVGLALFQALADAWPDDLDARMRVLRETEVIADGGIL